MNHYSKPGSLVEIPCALLFNRVFKSVLLDGAFAFLGRISGSSTYSLGDFRQITELCGPHCSLLGEVV